MRRVTRNFLVDINDFNAKEVIKINSGDELIIETTTPEKKPNLTGPILINDINQGDTVAITIKEIKLLNDGILFFASSKVEPWGGVLKDKAGHSLDKKVDIQNNVVRFSPNISFNVSPMVGWIALINNKIDYDPGDHGGNMDIKELKVGSTLFLHDKEGCGKFLLGDVHALMGDGEICGTGVEISSEVTIRVDVIKKTKEHRPIIVNDEYFITIASRKTHEEAYRQCTLDMVNLLMESQKISFEEANVLLSAIGDLRISSVVSSVLTYKMIIKKEYLLDPIQLIS